MTVHPPAGWFALGTHVDTREPLEFSPELDEAGLALWERPRDAHISDGPLPEIVVLCGSTRFKDAWYSEGKRLTYEGRIVLSVGDLDPSESARTSNVPVDEGLKAKMDALHRQKIRLADRVHVLNVGGYVGATTRSEVEFAQALGRTVTYLEPATAVSGFRQVHSAAAGDREGAPS